MEFPDLGKHCTDPTCNQLDFLPMKCDACEKIFCMAHFRYNAHQCPSSYKKDNQVPVCPLCGIPIPVKRGEMPDTKVGQHIDSDCQSDPAKEKRKVFVNRCRVKGCRQKEIMKVICPECGNNYCLTHRHPQDHHCSPKSSADHVREAALSRQQPSGQKWFSSFLPNQTARTTRPQAATSRTTVTAVQAGLSEDEALARALQASMSDSSPAPTVNHVPTSVEQEDRMLAEAIAASEREAQPQRRRHTVERCTMA